MPQKFDDLTCILLFKRYMDLVSPATILFLINFQSRENIVLEPVHVSYIASRDCFT